VSTRWARFARGWLAALFSTLVAAVSHTLAGGTSPSAVSFVVALAFAGIACVALTGKRLSIVRLVASVVLSQLAFHSLFSSIGVSSGTVSAPVGAHEHGAALAQVATGGGAMHHTDAWMWAAHAFAAVVTIVALRHGEAAFWRLRETALLFLRTIFARVPVVPSLPSSSRAPLVWAQHLDARTCDFIRSSLGLRGPPVSSLR
jgi:hypothetical protein